MRGSCHCLLDISNRVVHLDSLSDLLGSNIANIIIPQADSEREREMRRGREGQPLLTRYK
jgi:hypothetical protein